jgi:hypothetical protein
MVHVHSKNQEASNLQNLSYLKCDVGANVVHFHLMGYACASVHSGGPHAEFAHGVVYAREIYIRFVLCVCE